MSDTPETDSSPRLVRLFCHGRCVKRGTCKGEVRRVTVKDGDGRGTWGEYNYCEAAILEDERNGYIVLPNNVIPKTMSDTLDNFVRPIAKVMKEQGLAYLLIAIRSDGEAAYVVDTVPVREVQEPPIKNCRKCFGHGQVEIQSGPYMRECPECGGSGKQTNQPKP